MNNRVLIAGIGNIFFGDDAFGVEVVKRLATSSLPAGMCVKDFGIRGFDLACALIDPWELIIMVDALPRGGTPGSIYLMDVTDSGWQPPTGSIEGHGLHPAGAIELARSMGQIKARLLLVGCEPAKFGGHEGEIGLSPPAEGAIEAAIGQIVRAAHEFIQPTEILQGVNL